MSAQTLLVVEIASYTMAARVLVKWFRGFWRDLIFAALNIAALYLFFFRNPAYDSHRQISTLVVYVVIVVWQFAMFRLFIGKKGWLPWVAFFAPILVLVLVRYVPTRFYEGALLPYGPFFIGISYLAFRSSHLVLEVRNGVAPAPSLCQYLGFCFFLPTMSVGPINPYSNHARGFAERPAIPEGRATLRILVGLVKYKFLGSILSQMTYSNLLFNDHYHHWIDLFVAILFYYLFLYCNFSGFCDMAIGLAGLIGIPVAENFNSPFAARNVKDFWNRWHITLSTYMRDVVFSPLSKFLVRVMGPANANHAIALTIIVVFLLVGIWHGVGWNFAAYGAAHALGVVANHYYTIGLKKWLGREGFKAYNANRWVHAIAVCLTFCYCAATLLFFANTFPELKQIFSMLR
jgi:D-alanyl-lipoteichoic acid acyltransferase DltB (MBOAT superfamily)